MPSAQQLYSDGHLDAAIAQLGVELREHPGDARRRAFLFELLAFTGDWTRAAKQLEVLASAGPQAAAGTMLYRSALDAERVREHMFDTGDFPVGDVPAPVAGTLNGEPVTSIVDADPRIGARLEVVAGGRYLWIPFAHLASVTSEPPSQLRDLKWLPARITTGPQVRDLELGDVLLPALTPDAQRDEEDPVRLGRATAWIALPDGRHAPIGRKVLLVDDREVPMTEVRELFLHAPADA